MSERLPEFPGPKKQLDQVSDFPTSLFDGGWVQCTSQALDAFAQVGIEIQEVLSRHLVGDWGEISQEIVLENKLAIEQGGRIHSIYQIAPAVKISVITDQETEQTFIDLMGENGGSESEVLS